MSKNRRVAFSTRLFVLLLSNIAYLAAQSSSGTIQGTIHDTSGAVVPGARVHITQGATSVATDVVSNSSGIYIAPSLIAGQYKISVESQGFARWDGSLTLRAAQTAEVNIALSLAATSDQITVMGDITPLVTTDNGTVSNTLDRQRIEQLPLNGRDLSTLLQLTIPGVYFDGSGVRVDGLNWDAFEFVQDGAVTADRDGGGVLQQRLPGLDSIGEVRVETNSSSAKMNRPGTGIISTKGGSNQWHGSLFETNRDNGYGLARARQDNYKTAPQLIRNEFGGSIGGPVMLPSFGLNGKKFYSGKSKTFFFFNWEGLEQRQGVTKSFSMPTAAMREGDFSTLVDSLGRRLTIYDPLTTDSSAKRTPFVGNSIPITRLSPLAKAMYAITPLPTEAGVNPVVGNNWIGLTPNNESDKTMTARFDQNFGAQDKGYFRFSRGSRFQNFLGGNGYGPQTTDGSANITYRPIYNDGGAISWTHVYSPNLFAETVISENYTASRYYTGQNPNLDYASKLGLPNNFGQPGFPNITGIGFTTQYGQNDNARASSQFITVMDHNYTYMKGRHQLQFGARYRHERLHILPDMSVSSSVGFSNLATALVDSTNLNSPVPLAATGFAGADFFMGYASSYQVSQNFSWLRFRDQEISTFLQDDYKLNSRLTLNLGVRWEIHPGVHEGNGAFSTFDLKNKAIVTPTPIDELARLGYTSAPIMNLYNAIGVKFETTQQAGLPSGIWQTYWKSVAPRVGLAWKASGTTRPTMIRVGYGVYVYPPPLRNFYTNIKGNPPFQSGYSLNWTAAALSPDGIQNYLLRSKPTIVAGQNSADVIDINSPATVTPGNFATGGLDPNFPPTYVHQWNFTIERELIYHTVFSLNYTGNHGTNLEQFWSYNDKPTDYIWYSTTGQPLPTGTYSNTATRPYDNRTYGTVQLEKKSGYSNNNSFKLQAQRLFKNGMAFQFFYTLSNGFRNGGNGWRDSTVYPTTSFLPGTISSNTSQMFRDLYYVRDTGIPKHQMTWNWLADLPFGKGKKFMGNANRAMNALVGGWQFAGTGNSRRWFWTPYLSDYMLSNVQINGTSEPIMDCRSGSCQRGYLYYNGYISPIYLNQPKGITGLPTDYTPSHQPLNPVNCPTSNLCGTNNVVITLANGNKITTAYAPGQSNLTNPWHKVVFPAPWNYTMNASLFKTFKITERAGVRLQADAFNILNMPGLNNPDNNTGILSLQNSSNSPRVLQMTLRLTF